MLLPDPCGGSHLHWWRLLPVPRPALRGTAMSVTCMSSLSTWSLHELYWWRMNVTMTCLSSESKGICLYNSAFPWRYFQQVTEKENLVIMVEHAVSCFSFFANWATNDLGCSLVHQLHLSLEQDMLPWWLLWWLLFSSVCIYSSYSMERLRGILLLDATKSSTLELLKDALTLD